MRSRLIICILCMSIIGCGEEVGTSPGANQYHCRYLVGDVICEKVATPYSPVEPGMSLDCQVNESTNTTTCHADPESK